jgi:hypothetical protein
MKAKRIVAMVLSLMIMLCALPIVSNADSADILIKGEFDKAKYKRGDSVNFTISVSGATSNPIAAADFSIEYDSNLLKVSSSQKLVTSYSAGNVIENKSDLSVSNPKDGLMRVFFMDNSNNFSRIIKNNGTLLKITFSAVSNIDAPIGLVKFVNDGDFCRKDLKVYTTEFSVSSYKPDTTSKVETNPKPETKPVVQNTAKPNSTTSSKNDSKPSSETKVKKLSKVKGVKLKSVSKRTVRVTYKKVKGASKYSIRYSYKKNMKKAKFVSSKKLKVTLKKLQRRKRVYIQVRAVSGKVKGAYSVRKSVKVK